MKEIRAFEKGFIHAKIGKSIHYNPFRNKGDVIEFLAWERGYKKAVSQ